MTSVKWWWCGALYVAACSFETSDFPSEIPPTETSSGQTDTTGAPPSGDSSTTGTSEQTSPTSPTSTSTDETSAASGKTGGESGTGTGDLEPESGCPQPLPEGWVLCEDFEAVADLASHFSEVFGSGMGIGEPGFSSSRALEITHLENQRWAGELVQRFGEGPPANNVVDPESQFDEVWVRLRFRGGEGWPVRGPGDLLSIDGFENGGAWASTFKARLSADRDESAIRNSAFSCMFGNQNDCDGTDDWIDLVYLGGELGTVNVFAESTVAEWHCAVLHARLNTPGTNDGLVEVEVDGQLDASTTNLDLRGTRGDLGFNAIAIPAFMEIPLEGDHRRYVDDLVVSTQALSCD